jgi:hypothetical protein
MTADSIHGFGGVRWQTPQLALPMNKTQDTTQAPKVGMLSAP